MYTKCSNCSTSFYINEEQITHSGRYVRCSKCSYVWHLQNNDIENQSQLSNHKSSIKTYNLPAIIPNNGTKNTNIFTFYRGILAFSVLIAIGLCVYLYSNKAMEVFIEDVSIYKTDDREVVLSYKITHVNYKHGFFIPLVDIELLDENYKVIASYKEKELLGHFVHSDHAHITTKFRNVPSDIFYATVKLKAK